MKRSLLLALALSACSAQTPIVTPTTSQSTAPSPSPSATVRIPPRVAQRAVYVLENGIYVYDVKSNTAARVAEGENIGLAKFYSESAISFIQDQGSGAVLRVVDTRSKQVDDLFTVDTGILTYGWSPDHLMVGYLTADESGYPHLYIRQVVGQNAPRHVATLARIVPREYDIGDQLRVSWSPDGSYVLVVDTAAEGDGGRLPDAQSPLQVRGADGTLAFAADSDRAPTMAVWSGARVFYRASNGLRMWTPGKTASVSAKGSVRWFDPYASLDGRIIAYDTGASSLQVRVRSYDTRTGGSTDVSTAGFAYPLVADARTVWGQRVQKCEPDCLTSIVPGPEVFAFDLVTHKSRKLAIPTLVDTDVYFAASATGGTGAG